MNFIAHLFLSGTNEGLIVGNFIADAVKGNTAFNIYPDFIKRGIVLHRKIDSFTDNHPIFRESKSLLVPKYNHFAGVLVDIFYDHFLTKNWNKYTDEDLEHFSNRCLNTIEVYWEFIPEKMQMFFRHTKKYDRINGYTELKTIANVLMGMNSRSSFVSGMDKAAIDLELNFEVLQKQFLLFFPELQNFVKKELL